MNNVSPINKASRLTEAEVHAAAEELQEAGGKVSSIELYKHLGRGSLTTITNFMKTWRPGEEERSTLPALVSLPETLRVASEQLIIKVWAESQKMAESELQSQREAMRQAKAMASEKVEEAQAFSDEQAKQIEDLKTQIEILKEEANKAHDYFLYEVKNLRNDLDNSRKNATIFEERFNKSEKDRIEEKERRLIEIRELSKERDNALKEAAKVNGELIAWKTLQPKGKDEKTVAKKENKKIVKEEQLTLESQGINLV